MNRSCRRLLLISVCAAAMAGAPLPVQADENGTSASDPGFVPQTGQINPGSDKKLSTSAKPRPVPSQEEARAALMMPDSGRVSVGAAVQAVPPAKPLNSDQKDAQNAAGGPTASQAGKIENDGSGSGAANATTGSGRAGSGTQTNNSSPQAGPIGATLQTMPAKFSKRNDILDRVPIMAFPLRLDAQQRRQIFQAVMADKTQPAAAADHLAAASQLPSEVALTETHPLPAALAGIKLLQGLDYVKGKNKILLVEPATRVVVDEIVS